MSENDKINPEDAKSVKRKIRHRRRVRNQILSYVILLLLIGILSVVGFMGARKLVSLFVEQKARDEAAISENIAAQDSVSDDNLTISSPDAINSPSENSVSDNADEVPEEPEIDPEIMAIIESMTPEQKAGALFMVSPEAITGVDVATRAGDGTKAALEKFPVGAIVYSKQNVTDKNQFMTMVGSTREMYNGIYAADNEIFGLMTAVREEGAFNTLAEGTGENAASSASDIGASGEKTNAYQAYLEIGSYLNKYQIDIDIAPVCDVASESGYYQKDRSFGTDPEVVASMTSSAVSGLSDQSIVSCLTTFPGQGSVVNGISGGSTSTERSLDEFKDFEYKPFASAIDEGAEMVMVGNLAVAEENGEKVPSYISYEMITEELKGNLGFDGVVITDDLSVIAKDAGFDQGEAALRAINAGADMIYVSSDFENTYNDVLKAINDGAITEERLNDALARIYTMKADM
ncbi:MAG: glycoside hydrolase family 3 N-terminal domain-containing protein [Lachnospiraceae bacterium]